MKRAVSLILSALLLLGVLVLPAGAFAVATESSR